MPMHMHIDRGSAGSRPPVRAPRGAARHSMARWTGFIDETDGYEKSPDGTVPPGGRSLAHCLTWRQAASKDHDSELWMEG